MASYLDDLLKKANQALITNSKRATNQAMLGSQQAVTNTTRQRTQGIETNTISRQTQNSSLQTILKQAKAYDPFAVVNKTQADLQKPLTYLNDILINNKTSEVNKTMLQGLVDEQTKYLGKNLVNVDTKTLAAADWTSFNNLTGDVAKYNSLRDSYLAKKTKTKVDTDWIKQYDTLLADTYKAMSGEIPKILTNARSSYDTIAKTRDTTIAAIESLLPIDKQDRKKTMDVSSVDPRSQIANRVKLVSDYVTKKPTPVFSTRPT